MAVGFGHHWNISTGMIENAVKCGPDIHGPSVMKLTDFSDTVSLENSSTIGFIAISYLFSKRISIMARG